MKKITFAIMALASAALFTSCMDGKWDSDDVDATVQTTYGNDTITEHNVVTLKELRASKNYKNVLAQFRDYQLVEDDIQLKVRVTGNDIGGNLYNKVSVQDENGDAIIICVYSGGLFSYLPVGQQLLVNLKGLYIGTYGYQQQIGTPYTTSSGNTYPGRMDKNLWQQHFRLIGTPDASAASIQPVEFTSSMASNFDAYAGKLMTIKNATLTNGGRDVWAKDNNSDFSISQYINGFPSSVVVYTSTSAKFAGDSIPAGKVNITGVFTRYNTTWQIVLRDLNDVQSAE